MKVVLWTAGHECSLDLFAGMSAYLVHMSVRFIVSVLLGAHDCTLDCSPTMAPRMSDMNVCLMISLVVVLIHALECPLFICWTLSLSTRLANARHLRPHCFPSLSSRVPAMHVFLIASERYPFSCWPWKSAWLFLKFGILVPGHAGPMNCFPNLPLV